MGAGTENHGAGQTEMGEKQLPKVLVNGLPCLVLHLDGAVSKGKPLEPGAEIAILLQRHQRAPGGHDGVPHLLCQGVAAAFRARQGVGAAAGCQDHAAARNRAAAGLHAADRSFPGEKLYGLPAEHFHTAA